MSIDLIKNITHKEWIKSCPVQDSNFKPHLKNASDTELKELIEELPEKGNVAKIAAIKAELRQRQRAEQGRRVNDVIKSNTYQACRYRLPTNNETFAEAFVREVYNDLDDIKHSFIRIGFRLKEANENKYFVQLGYTSLAELAEDKFGFKKSTTYDLMAVYELAHDKTAPMEIDKTYDGYSQSQLLAMTRAKYSGTAFYAVIKPTDSVRDIEKFVSLWNKKYAKGCGYRPGCTTVAEYLKQYEEEDRCAPVIYPNQLEGQLAIEFPEDKETQCFSSEDIKENSEPELPEWQAKARDAAHSVGLPFYAGDPEDFDPYVFDGNMSVEDYDKMWELRNADKNDEDSKRLENSKSGYLTNREYLQAISSERFAYLICETIEKIKKKNNTDNFTDIVIGLAAWLHEQYKEVK